jgi:hypothetical protein
MLTIDDFTVVDRAEVLFASALPTGSRVTAAQLDDTIAETLRARGGVTGCAAEMAAVFGESPGFAAERMRWALRVLRPAATRTGEAA